MFDKIAKNMLIIQDESGTVIAAQILEPDETDLNTYIFPSSAEHTLSEVTDVPAEIHGLEDMEEFQRAMTDYITQGRAQLRETSAAELRGDLMRLIFPEEDTSTE